METKGGRYAGEVLMFRRRRFGKSGGVAMIPMHEADLQTRWESLLRDLFNEALHNLAVEWPDTQSVEVSYRDLERWDLDFAQSLLVQPELHIEASKQAVKQVLVDEGHGAMDPFIRIVHLPSDQTRAISHLRAEDLGQMLAIDAVTTKISGVRPRIYIATFRCSSCGHLSTVHQPNEQELIQPMLCDPIDGGCDRKARETRFTLVERDSSLINTQFIELQELPEQMRGGIQPERIMCIAEQDLCGQLNPGDRVKANGSLFIRSQRKGGKDTPVFDIFLRIHSLERQNVPLEEVVITEEEVREIKDIARRKDIYQVLTRSIAPSIYGMAHVKQSLMLQLFGGVSRKNDDGTRSRGDIHILLMGDPGVAKSQLLSYMAQLSPRGRFTSGMSASAAGLTAAAVQDANADGRWTLEAGALVLADLGLAAIDEFDKMNDGDRSSMHEAMEQQRISIAKAGINASLQTRCAVLAAANPKAGRFQPISDKPFTAQTNLTPPLISRFDVIWVLTDVARTERDTAIAAHILSTRASGTSETLIAEGTALDPSRGVSQATSNQDGEEILETNFVKKYVAYAKRNIQPEPTKEASEMLVAYYVETRQQGGTDPDSIAITARAIEGISRLAEASARIRLSDTVEVEDAERALTLTRFWRMELMGDNFDVTTLQTGKKGTARSKERRILDTVRDLTASSNQGHADLNEVLNELDRNGLSRSEAEDLIERMVTGGALLRPRGYDTLMVA